MPPSNECPAIEQTFVAGSLPRHRHHAAYAAVIVEGSYIERGTSGRWAVECGQVVMHNRFDCHDNVFLRGRTRVLNIPVPGSVQLPPVFTVADPDTLLSAARVRAPDAHVLLRPYQTVAPALEDWPDRLAALLREQALSIGDWARQVGLAPATVSRGFFAAYGVSAAGYRAEARTLRALALLKTGSASLAGVATECGFADQAHLSRSVKSVSGLTPQQWRKVNSIQDP